MTLESSGIKIQQTKACSSSKQKRLYFFSSILFLVKKKNKNCNPVYAAAVVRTGVFETIYGQGRVKEGEISTLHMSWGMVPSVVPHGVVGTERS